MIRDISIGIVLNLISILLIIITLEYAWKNPESNKGRMQKMFLILLFISLLNSGFSQIYLIFSIIVVFLIVYLHKCRITKQYLIIFLLALLILSIILLFFVFFFNKIWFNIFWTGLNSTFQNSSLEILIKYH